MEKRIPFLITIIIILLGTVYIISHPEFDSYNERHKAGFIALEEEKYQLAEHCLLSAVELAPKKLDGYGALSYFYSKMGMEDKSRETFQRAYDIGFTTLELNKVVSAYNKIHEYNAVYMTNQDNEIFIYYGNDGNPKHRDEIYDNGSFVRSRYIYENGRIVSETMIKTEGLYTWRDATMEYVYDDAGRLIQKNDSTRGYIKYYYDENGNISLIDYETKYSTGNGKTPYKEFYENGVLTKTQSSSGRNTIDKETYYSPEGRVERVNTLKNDGTVSKYYLYTYSTEGDKDITLCKSYFPDDVLDYCETTTAIKVKTCNVVTEKYNPRGEVIKTTVESEDGTVTVTRPSDHIAGARLLTQAEIDRINSTDHKISCFLHPFDQPKEVYMNSVIASMPANGQLTDQSKEELKNLKAEGVALDYDGIEIELAWYLTYKKVNYADVIQLLENYINIPYEQMVNKASYPYSQQYDCFYVSTSKSQDKFICVGGEIGDDMLKLYSADRTVVFEKQGEKYYINAVIEADHSDLVENPQEQQPAPPPRESIPQPEIEYEMVPRKQVLPTDASKGRAYNEAIRKYNDIIKSYVENEYDVIYYSSYVLHELTNDNIPELVIMRPWSSMEIYACINGKINMLATPTGGGGDGGKTLLKNGIVQGQMHKGDYKSYGFYTYNQDGSANKVEFGIYWNYDNKEYDCEINGEKVSREEYNRFIQPYRKIYNDSATYTTYPAYDRVPVTATE